jgi:Flp pilus assembly pilin Flp
MDQFLRDGHGLTAVENAVALVVILMACVGLVALFGSNRNDSL